MRKLKLWWRHAPSGMPVLAAAALMPGCAFMDTESGGTAPERGGADTDGGTGDAGNGEEAGVVLEPSKPDASNNTYRPPSKQAQEACTELVAFGVARTVQIPVPEEGTAAKPGEICAISTDPVTSPRAALVTLDALEGDSRHTAGSIIIDPVLRDSILGTPVLEVVDGTDDVLGAMEATNISPTNEGFSFDAEWPSAPSFHLSVVNRLTVRVTLQVDCDGTPHTVHAATDVHACLDEEGQPTWASSGDTCYVCDVIAEMAPSPIVPETEPDGLPLAQALRARIVELARVGNTVILLAENDGGPGMAYEWHPSVGSLKQLSDDVVAWTIPPTAKDPLIQGVVQSPNAAAVASWAFNAEAA